MSDEFGLSARLQDKIVCLIITDTKFVESCVRKKISSDLFGSEIAKSLVDLALEYYGKYFSAIGFDNLVEILSDEIYKDKKIKKENVEAYSFYLNKISDFGDISEDARYLLDNLDSFIKKKVINKLTNSLIKMRERPDIDLNKPIEVIKDAIKEIESKTGKQVVETILEQNYTNEHGSDIVTRFNIPYIDRALKGGFKTGQFAIVLGYQGVGKSWCCTHLIKHAVRLGETVLFVDLERSNRRVKLRLKMAFSGLSEEEILVKESEAVKAINNSLIKKSNVILLNEEEKIMDVDSIESILDAIKEKYKKDVRLIIYDSADALQPPQGKYRDDRDKSTAIYTYLKNFAKDKNICIITTTQAKAEAAKKYWTTHHHTAEDINKIRKAIIGISVNITEEEDNLGYYRMFLFKNTDGESGMKVWAKRDLKRGQFMIDSGAYERIRYEEMLKVAESNL